MRGLLALRGLVGIAVMSLPASQTLAQSGVISGPPQVRPAQGGPGLGPDYRPGQGRPDGPSAGRQDGVWIAVVGGFDGKGGKVAIGYSGHKRSRAEAEIAAIRACHRNEPTVACRDPVAVSNGCLYIVPGSRANRGVTWGRGRTRQIAFEQCRRGGYTCPGNKIIGGCVPGYN